MFKKILIIIICFVLVFGNFIPRALAKTTVTQKTTSTIEVVVEVAFDFTDNISKEEAHQAMLKWEQGMNFAWNTADGNQKQYGQSNVKYIFKTNQVATGKNCQDYPDDHCYFILKEAKNSRGNYADATIINPNSGQNSWGDWSINTNSLGAAHEIGHAMGLKDEYHYNNGKYVNDNQQSSGPQSIMAQTWDYTSGLEEHTYQIMQLAKIAPVQDNNTLAPKANDKVVKVKQQTIPKYSVKISQPLTNNYYSNPNGQKIYSEKVPVNLLISTLVKGESDAKVYFVDDQGIFHWLTSEKVAQQKVGADWNRKIYWFNDSLISSYKKGEPLY